MPGTKLIDAPRPPVPWTGSKKTPEPDLRIVIEKAHAFAVPPNLFSTNLIMCRILVTGASMGTITGGAVTMGRGGGRVGTNGGGVTAGITGGIAVHWACKVGSAAKL